MQLTEAMPRDAECLYTLTDINAVLNDLAAELNRDYADKNPLLLCVMNGAVITMGQLLPKLDFALQIDYIHASRYGDNTVGGDLVWQARPKTPMSGRHILLIEDIYDEGHTLIALRHYCQQQGALSVACMALADKQHSRKTGQPPEYIGLSVVDRYVFGFGMDVQGYWRNAPGIFVMAEINS